MLGDTTLASSILVFLFECFRTSIGTGILFSPLLIRIQQIRYYASSGKFFPVGLLYMCSTYLWASDFLSLFHYELLFRPSRYLVLSYILPHCIFVYLPYPSRNQSPKIPIISIDNWCGHIYNSYVIGDVLCWCACNSQIYVPLEHFPKTIDHQTI